MIKKLLLLLYTLPSRIIVYLIYIGIAFLILITDIHDNKNHDKSDKLIDFLIDWIDLKNKGLYHILNCFIWIAIIFVIIKIQLGL